MDDSPHHDPEAWGQRRGAGDGAPLGVTSGLISGTNGARLTWRGLLAVTALLTLVASVNVMTILDDDHRRGVAVALWLPVTLEGSSALAAMLVATLLVPRLVAYAPPDRGPWWRTVAIHLAGSLAFSAAHVALMTVIRIGVFAARGLVYQFHLSEAPYEYRKDFVAYLVIAGIVWALSRPGPAPQPEPASRQTAAAPMTFDIRDGANLLRVPVAEILAAQAAGNYVEFALADGRRPLMRASMAQIEAALAIAGFVRTHRSWLVNAACVRGLAPVGSGDFRIELAGGLTAPLSRRYPAALAILRGEV